MKRYFGPVAFKVIIEFEDHEIPADFEDMPEIIEAMCPELYDGAREAGLFIGGKSCPQGTRCIIVEETPRLVLRLLIPPRLV
jgi:hypothetical protein